MIFDNEEKEREYGEMEKQIEEKEAQVMALKEEIEKLKIKRAGIYFEERFPVGSDVTFLGEKYKVEGYSVVEYKAHVLYLRKYKMKGNLSMKVTEIYGNKIDSVFPLKNKEVRG